MHPVLYHTPGTKHWEGVPVGAYNVPSQSAQTGALDAILPPEGAG